ncbi:MAG: YggS family pyridoxal phosphate-dependent enzyme [Lewinellaceae bacterium]|nr:YggS family pyridoxal phosphate-dependent enzyme [Lewinella sp.]MCB9278571.1 YggS family pyridoxal phosphate-dependent enzyme [Lewinellaceae bacterium]
MLSAILDQLKPYRAKLVAVSKRRTIPEIRAIYDQGQRDFAENRVQDLLERREALPADIRWHLIGHLQSNKVKYIADFIHLIHAVDSLGLLQEIDKRAQAAGRVIDCLLQFKIAEEDTKYGIPDLAAAEAMLGSAEFSRLSHVRVCGVMGMATFTDDEDRVRAEFRKLAGIFKALKSAFFKDNDRFSELSMGMSGDYGIALEEGSTLVRIGTLLFEGAD